MDVFQCIIPAVHHRETALHKYTGSIGEKETPLCDVSTRTLGDDNRDGCPVDFRVNTRFLQKVRDFFFLYP